MVTCSGLMLSGVGGWGHVHGCSTVNLIGFTCPAMTIGRTVTYEGPPIPPKAPLVSLTDDSVTQREGRGKAERGNGGGGGERETVVVRERVAGFASLHKEIKAGLLFTGTEDSFLKKSAVYFSGTGKT